MVPRLKEFDECKYENKLDLALELQNLNKIYLVKDINFLDLELIREANIINISESKNSL